MTGCDMSECDCTACNPPDRRAPHPTLSGLTGWRTLSAAHALRDLSCLELLDAANVARHEGDDGAANLLMAVLSARLDGPALGRRS